MDAAPLLAAKLLPPAPGVLHLVRPRLHERLASGIEGRVAAVVAGPGYGKTALVARFVQERPEDLVWYSLDDGDRDPRLFFRYLIQGLRSHAPEFGERIESLSKDPSPPAEVVSRLADLFVSEVEETLAGRLVLVLDGVQHLPAGGPCIRALHRLLAYLPGSLAMVLVGRSIPEVGLRALEAEGRAVLVQDEELRFTVDETRELLEGSFGLKLPAGTVERVHSRTRGWVTALQLLRQTARLGAGGTNLPEDVFTRTEAEVFDYFSEEVFASVPESIREFLLVSSLPEFIDPEICAEALGGRDVRGILSRLLEMRLFLSPLKSQGEFYAYDPLFRDFLRRKLQFEKGSAERQDLERRYEATFARRGAFPEALAHGLAADDVAGVLDLLRRHGHALLRRGTLETVSEAGAFLLARGVRSAHIEDLLGEVARLAHDHAAAAEHFERSLAASGPEGPELRGAERARAMQGLAYSLMRKGEPAKALETAQRALAEAGLEDLGLVARILNTIAIIRYRENRLDEALTGWQQALARARQAGDDHLVRMVAHNMGLPHAARGDFHRAAECFRILASPENTHLGPQEGAAYLNLARIATIKGELTRAASLLRDTTEIARKLRLESLAADVLEAEGNVLREAGDLESAKERYSRARQRFTELGQHDVVMNVDEETALLAARGGASAEAERTLSDLVERWRSSGDREGLASSLLALGEVRVRAGRDADAVGALEESVEIYGPLDRAYQECQALLWLALARHRSEAAAAVPAAAAHALEIAAQHDYRFTVFRIAGQDEGFLAGLRTLPGAPAWLKQTHAITVDAPGTPPPDLTVRLLGPVEVFRDAKRAVPASAWRIRRAFEMLCFLASARGRRATKEQLVEALWERGRPATIERNFYPTISVLRRALNHGHAVSRNFITLDRGGYSLNPAYRYDLDVETFEEFVRAARVKASRGETEAALADYAAALGLYRGPFMEHEDAGWSEAPRAHFERLHRAALSEAADLHMRAGDPGIGVTFLRELTSREPTEEGYSGRLMRALADRGDRAGVEKEYQRLVRALGRHLGTKPLAKTRREYENAIRSAAARGSYTNSESLGPGEAEG